jgi:hypothetical protein
MKYRNLIVAFMLVHFFWLLEFKFRFEFYFGL